jgi:hypothetical protein
VAVVVFALLAAASLLPVLLTPIPAMVDYPNHLARGEHLVDIEGVTGSIPVAPTIQSPQTARFRYDAK